jgi:ribonuclease J
MRICIHRGTKEIGGTCVEIESQDKRLVLDVGLPLDALADDTFPLHPIRGFESSDPSLLGVVITHPHQDHYGLAHRLPVETNFLIGEAGQAILAAAALFSPAGVKLKVSTPLVDRKPIHLGPFTITPFLVDHSAYDSYAVMVEADGKRLFYTGDFRAHGRKGSLTNRLIENPPTEVDVLLMEGTCIGREVDDVGFPTEDDLVPRLTEIFRKTKGMPLVWCSSQNIDRLVTIFKACRQARRQFILDVYTAEILRATGNERLPQADWNGIKVFLPFYQKLRIVKEKAFDVASPYYPYRIYPETFAQVASKSVLLFRPSMVRELETAGCLDDACVVCSVWGGYIDAPRNEWFLKWTKDCGTPLHRCHTSGHASVPDLQRMRGAFPNAVAVPVHLTDRKRFSEIFSEVELHEDGEWWSAARD